MRKAERLSCVWRLPVWSAWVVLALLSAPLLLLPVNHDSIWQVWIGREMLAGRELYASIIEPNPPLLLWFALIQAWIAEFIGTRLSVIVSCLALAALSLSLTPRRYWIPALAAVIIIPIANFGKAEQLTLIATIPYVFLIAARFEGEQVRHPWLIGFLGAFGFAMKPWFILVPVALELFAKPRVRPENVALVISAIAYGVAVLIFAPAYVTDIIPLARDAYGSFRGNEYPDIMMFGFLCLAAGIMVRRLSPSGLVLVVAAVAFIPAVYIQAKWWSYQTIPARGFLLLAVTTELMRARSKPVADSLFVVAALLCFYPIGIYRNPVRAETEDQLRGISPGTSIALLSTDPEMAWPMVDEYGLKWRLSEICLWQLPAAQRNPVVAKQMRNELRRDFGVKPTILILDRNRRLIPALAPIAPKGFLDGYRLRLRTQTMESYVKAS